MIVDVQAETCIYWSMTVAILGALEAEIGIFATDVANRLIDGPSTIREWLVPETTPEVLSTSEPLNSKNSKQQENEEHKKDGVAQIRQRIYKRSDQSSHLRKGLDAFQWANNSQNS